MLPFALMSPRLVATLFNMGSLIILGSFAVMYGVEEFFLRKFMVGAKKLYAVGYCVTLVLCLYFSLFTSSYIMTFLCLIGEVIFMLYFVACYFPGGK